MPDGFDVRPDALRRGAADLRTDAGALESTRATASEAIQLAAGGAGTGPLAGTAHDFAAGLERAMSALRQGVVGSADALEATATQYLTADQHSASRLDSIPVPGFDPPR